MLPHTNTITKYTFIHSLVWKQKRVVHVGLDHIISHCHPCEGLDSLVSHNVDLSFPFFVLASLVWPVLRDDQLLTFNLEYNIHTLNEE